MAEAEAKDQKLEQKKDKKAEEQKEDKPLILEVELHCSGCIKKIRRHVLKIRGVEEVEIDPAQNHVKIKGVVSPQEVCDTISKKTKRRTKVISPPPTSEADPLPQLVISQVSGLTSVELNAYLHCEACADHLKRRILKMRGVQTAAADFSSGKVTVTGTMDPNKLIEYVYKHTKKQAQIIPKPKPEPEPKPEPQQEEKEVDVAAAVAVAVADNDDSKKAEPKEDVKPQEEVKKDEPKEATNANGEKGHKGDDASNEEEHEKEQPKNESGGGEDENKMTIMPQQIPPVMHHQVPYHYYYQPIYVIERVPNPPYYPSPMFFSDENPNACCVS